MNSRDVRRRHDDPDPAQPRADGRLTERGSDETRLEREGERAAHSGRSWQSNPYLRQENMPVEPGETLREWSRKHDAWQRGFEGGTPQASAGAAKEELEGHMLMDILQQHILGISCVRLEMRRNRWCIVRVSPPQRHARDAEGRNWDLHSFECGSLDESACPSDFRAMVDELRDRYDLR